MFFPIASMRRFFFVVELFNHGGYDLFQVLLQLIGLPSYLLHKLKQVSRVIDLSEIMIFIPAGARSLGVVVSVALRSISMKLNARLMECTQ
jgi:hypothetical protein